MKQLKKALKVVNIKHLKNTPTGNPRYLLALESEAGDYYLAKTPANASVGYKVSYTMEDKKFTFILHSTKAGNLIVDDFLAVE